MHCKKWLSDNEKAKIQIIHGLGEMSEYYEQFAEYITAKGVSVYLCEYREHWKDGTACGYRQYRSDCGKGMR